MKKILLNKVEGVGLVFSDEALALINIRRMKMGLKPMYGPEQLRRDPIAIAVVEKLGSKRASYDYSKIVVETYDERLYTPVVMEWDNDGYETLVLKPCLDRKFVDTLTHGQLIEVLRDMGILVNKEDDAVEYEEPEYEADAYECVASV